MKKIIIIGLIILVLFLSSAIVYLNNVFLPTTIKALIIKGIEEQTDSKVTLGALKVNIFKGLVLRDLYVYREGSTLFGIREASCIFLPWPFLEKKIVIPSISLNGAQIFLERRKDNTFNLAYLFAAKPAAAGSTPAQDASLAKASSAKTKKGFSFYIYRVNLSNSKVVFQDSTFDQPFIKALENVNLAVHLALPASIKFKFSAAIPAKQQIKINATGEFKIRSQELDAKLDILHFVPEEFSVYYAASGLKISDGSLNVSAELKKKDGAFYADLEAQGENIDILRDKLSGRLSIDARAVLEYVVSNRNLKYSGSAKVYNTVISGIKFVDKIDIINCGIVFNNSGLGTQNLVAQVLGLPVEARVILSNFADPLISVNAVSTLKLSALQGILKDRFKFSFPGEFDGEGKLLLSIGGKLLEANDLPIKGKLDFTNGSIKLEKTGYSLQGISGKMEFLKDGSHQNPLLGFALSSGDISLDSTFSFIDKLIKVYKCSGRYGLSDFSASGSVNITEPSQPEVNLAGGMNIDLGDLAKAVPKFKDRLEKVKPQGKVRVDYKLSGNINKLENCAVEAKAASEAISLYGFKGTNLFLDYSQQAGVVDIPSLRLSLYGGTLEAACKVNLNSKERAYWLDANLQGVKLEELKLDTIVKSKDISGVIQVAVKANGSLDDLTGSQGVGMLSIVKGRLWELDLFKGMGKLLFSQEFASITFSEGKCDFTIRDRSVFTDNLTLEGNMVNLSGPVKIGFDGSLNAKLNVAIVSELVPVTGTFKDVTTAIMGQTGKFAAIKINGTLREPKYKFEAAVTDIIKGLANTFLKNL